MDPVEERLAVCLGGDTLDVMEILTVAEVLGLLPSFTLELLLLRRDRLGA